jgi:hypothetical protein
MSDVVIAGIFTIVVALLGSFVGFQTHKLLRREKYKEAIYSQKVAAYKKLSRLLAETMILAMSEPSSLSKKTGDLILFSLEYKYLLPEKIFMAFGDFFKKTDANSVLAQAAVISNLIRDDLGIELITKEISETITSNPAVLKQIKLGAIRGQT